MKKIAFIVIFTLINSPFAEAQEIKGINGPSNWMNNWTNFKPANTEYRDASIILTGVISQDQKLDKKNTYLLVGVVYLTNNAVLTIEPGTIIKGDLESCGTLVITKGSKIMAEGEETNPIIFTSNKGIAERKPGDWGGIILLGEAPINKMGGVNFLDFNLDSMMSQYGGQNSESNSGILKYVRIEYAGRKLNALKELNGLSLAGVGSKTKLSFIQISYSNDDSFECYGGEVNFNNLISFRATDDDFDFTQGVQCQISNSIAIRHPYSSDKSGSRCFEIDSYDKVENADFSKKSTKITANTITLINAEENNQGLVREAIHVQEKSYLNLSNSVISGFSPFLLLDPKIANISENLAKISLHHLQINDCTAGVQSEDSTNNLEIANWYRNESFYLQYSKINNLELFVESNTKKNPDFRLKTSQNLAIGN
jgi:hypothetical protein